MWTHQTAPSELSDTIIDSMPLCAWRTSCKAKAAVCNSQAVGGMHTCSPPADADADAPPPADADAPAPLLLALAEASLSGLDEEESSEGLLSDEGESPPDSPTLEASL